MTFDELNRLAFKEGWTIDEDEDGYCVLSTDIEYPQDEEEDEDDDDFLLNDEDIEVDYEEYQKCVDSMIDQSYLENQFSDEINKLKF